MKRFFTKKDIEPGRWKKRKLEAEEIKGLTFLCDICDPCYKFEKMLTRIKYQNELQV